MVDGYLFPIEGIIKMLLLHDIAICDQNAKGEYHKDLAIIATFQKNYRIAYFTDCNLIKMLYENWKLWWEIRFPNDLVKYI